MGIVSNGWSKLQPWRLPWQEFAPATYVANRRWMEFSPPANGQALRWVGGENSIRRHLGYNWIGFSPPATGMPHPIELLSSLPD